MLRKIKSSRQRSASASRWPSTRCIAGREIHSLRLRITSGSPRLSGEAEEESLADSRLVPYIEGGERSSVQQASAEVPSSRDAGRAVRQLQLESRGLQNRSSISQSGNGS